MTQTTILAAAQTEATSTDVAVAAGGVATIGLYSASGTSIPPGVTCYLLIDTPGADLSIKALTGTDPAIVVSGPGTFRVLRPSITAYGLNVGAFSET